MAWMNKVAGMEQGPQSKSFAEFFAGIGLVHEALRQTGWQCVYANDIDHKKTEIYQAQFGISAQLHVGDVWNTKEVMKRLPVCPFLATASFPCIDLSLAGNWGGLSGEHSSAFFGFAKVLQAMGRRKPRVILLENVSGFLTSREGRDFTTVVKMLAEMGYWIDAFVIDAKSFVPQSRPRVFIIAINESQGHLRELSRPSPGLFGDAAELSLSASPLRPATLLTLMRSIELPTGWLAINLPVPREARSHLATLIDLDDQQDWWDKAAVEKHYEMMSERHRSQVNSYVGDGKLHVGTIFRRKRYGKTRAEVRFDGIAGCLRTPRGGSGRQIVIVVETGELRMRWMSPREYARLQGADNYPILGKVNQMLYGFGDGVCVPVIRWIDDHVLTPVYNAALKRANGGATVAG